MKSHPTTKFDRPVVWLDDDEYLNHSAVHELALRGVEVDQYSNVDSALDFVLNNDVDLVITDIMLPPGAFFDSAETHGGS